VVATYQWQQLSLMSDATRLPLCHKTEVVAPDILVGHFGTNVPIRSVSGHNFFTQSPYIIGAYGGMLLGCSNLSDFLHEIL
jgi:hypothetical protein